MNEIGGYFEVELQKHHELHARAMRFNLGRNCLEYILLHRRYRRVHIPFYSCDALLAPFHRTGTEYLFYQINECFEPIFAYPIAKDEAILYINYYGICDDVVHKLGKKFPKLIIDNSQAFFATAISNIDTFYSPRKFFGVPDGGYLYSSLASPQNLEQDRSYGRFRHLLLRIDTNASNGYNAYRHNEQIFNSLPLRGMSQLTHRLLCSINYYKAKKIRESNFTLLHSALANRNKLSHCIHQINGPLIYPLLIENGDRLKTFLRTNKVYCATYWPDNPARVLSENFEKCLRVDLVALPIDQRLTHKDMKTILELISCCEKRSS